MNKNLVVTVRVEANPELTLEELCAACEVTPEFIQELIEHGILDIEKISLATYHFHPIHLHRVRTVVHLQNDLEVNLPGAALVIDLMEEIDEMRTKIEMYEKHLFITKE